MNRAEKHIRVLLLDRFQHEFHVYKIKDAREQTVAHTWVRSSRKAASADVGQCRRVPAQCMKSVLPRESVSKKARSSSVMLIDADHSSRFDWLGPLRGFLYGLSLMPVQLC